MSAKSPHDHRLTPDITIRGRMPTPGEYKLHLELLNDAADAEDRRRPRAMDRWIGRDTTDLEHEVWVAVHRHGLVKQSGLRGDGPHRLTPYGRVYLGQRQEPQRDKQRRNTRPMAGGRDVPRRLRSLAHLQAELGYAKENYRFWARQDHRLTREEYAQKMDAERRVRELEAMVARKRKP